MFCHDGKFYSTAECDMDFRSMNNFRTYFRTKKGNYFSCDTDLSEDIMYNEEIDGVMYQVHERLVRFEDFKVVDEQEFKVELALTNKDRYEEMYGKLEYA